jgi:ethanolamine utilization protein EutN
MYLAKVIGTVVATEKNETLSGVKMLVVQPLDEDQKDMGEPIVAIDTVMSGPGDTVFYVTGREASMALEEEKKFSPVDAAIIGHVDEVAN